MKKLQVILLTALTAAMIFGCGKSDDSVTGISAEKIVKSTQETSASDTAATAASDDVPPAEGMVRSPFTNEWENWSENQIKKDIFKQYLASSEYDK